MGPLDQDGNETITDVFYSIDDTCETCWVSLDGDETSITLSDMDPGAHTFYKVSGYSRCRK